MDGGIAAADAADAGDDEPAKPPAPPPCACCGQPSKYRCPACDARTCSLLCVNKHKADKPCSGVRNTADYRPIQAFDDAALMHDYRFLEDAIRIVDSSKRRQRDVEAPPAATRRGGQTPARDNLVKQAHERGCPERRVPCAGAEHGCAWTGKLGEQEAHGANCMRAVLAPVVAAERDRAAAALQVRFHAV